MKEHFTVLYKPCVAIVAIYRKRSSKPVIYMISLLFHL